MVDPVDGIPGVEALSVQKKLAAPLRYKLKQGYYEMCGFVRARMSLAILSSNSLLLPGPHSKGVCIRQRPDLTDGSVMALLVPWRG